MTGDASLQVHAHSYFEVEDQKTGEVVKLFVMVYTSHSRLFIALMGSAAMTSISL